MTSKNTTRTTRAVALATLPLLATLTLAGCGSDDDGTMGGHTGMSGHMSGSASSSASHNDQDERFVEQMIPHHRQAVVMSRMAQTRAGSDQVRQLAQRIEAAQAPEIRTMTGWLRDWGVGGSMPGMGGMHGGHGMGPDDMPGMMSGHDLHDLRAASGHEFDRLFLEGMIEHHRGAVQMAEDEIAHGQDSDVIDLARSIKASQTKEIAQMQQMLGS